MRQNNKFLTALFCVGAVTFFASCSKEQQILPSNETAKTLEQSSKVPTGPIIKSVDFTATPQQENKGRTVQFSSKSLPGVGYYIGSYNWYFGDGKTLLNTNISNPQHTYASAGTYTVTLQLEIIERSTGASMGLFNSKPKSVSTNVIPVAEFMYEPFYSAFYNRSTNAASAIWNFGDGHIVNDNTKPAGFDFLYHIYDKPGIYTVTLTVTSVSGVVRTTTQQVEPYFAK